MAIVPRWEWRVFADDFGDVEARITEIEPDRVEESDEVYLLSASSDASVKLRDGLIDVKQLLAVRPDGLEQWKPVVKEPTTLDAANLRLVIDALNVNVEVLEVHKHRTRYTVEGLMGEITELTTDRGSVHTIAIESEDPERVKQAVHTIGLDGWQVVCMARGLKALLA
jgi:exopolyphosphatase/guanosine-5'-triphosphate,3'-diphosphate pyrophosphatase